MNQQEAQKAIEGHKLAHVAKQSGIARRTLLRLRDGIGKPSQGTLLMVALWASIKRPDGGKGKA